MPGINVSAVIKNFIDSYVTYLKQGKEEKDKRSTTSSTKAVVFDMKSSHIYCRFFYVLVKFFSITGYDVYFPNYNYNYYRKHFYKKDRRNYYKLLLEDNLMIFNHPPVQANIILTLTDESFSPNYFYPIFKNEKKDNSYFVPMSMHPNFYKLGIYNEPLDKTSKKKNSIFMIGNFDAEQYSRIKHTPFNIESRVETYNHLKEKTFYRTFNSLEKFNKYLDSDEEQNLILIDSRKVRIPTKSLREKINRFNFFLALPGLVKPLSHNLVEAISTGAIPIIHKSYVKYLVPELQHMKNAIIYNDLNDLEVKISIAFNLEQQKIDAMRLEIEEYYEYNYTPERVVAKLTSGNFRLIYLQTIQIGVKLFNRNYKVSE